MSAEDGRPTNVTPLRPSAEARPRLPPANTDAEQALLGAILINNAAYGRVAEFLHADHFSNAVHGRLYAATAKLIERGQNANPVTLKHLFDQDGALSEIGGAQYLARLAAAAVTIINAEDYGRVIHDLHLRRQLMALGEDIARAASTADLDDSAGTQIERAEEALFRLAESGTIEEGAQSLGIAAGHAVRMAERAFQHAGRTVGVATGFLDLDAMLGGLHASDLVILAGRPGMGKSALALAIARNAARAHAERPEEGAGAGFFSLEMSAEQLAMRLIGEESGIGADRMRRGALAHADFPLLLLAEKRLAGWPLQLDDTPALSLAAILSRARRMKRRHGIGLVVVDYLQLIAPDRAREKRVEEVSEISRGLKALAKTLDVPVLALSQLSRAVESRADKRPMLSDLRESGSIEQDADQVLFIYRDSYYTREMPEHGHELAEIIVAKNRHGPTGAVMLGFEGAMTRFSNAARG